MGYTLPMWARTLVLAASVGLAAVMAAGTFPSLPTGVQTVIVCAAAVVNALILPPTPKLEPHRRGVLAARRGGVVKRKKVRARRKTDPHT